MSMLVRFGISMEEDLLKDFDELIAQKGYTNRSEAIRDLVRDKLVDENLQNPSAFVYGALVILYDHHKRELEKSLSNIQHNYFENIVSTAHVHVDHDHCLEVILLKGKAKILQGLAEKILSFKGVKHGKLTLTTILASPPDKKNTHHHKH